MNTKNIKLLTGLSLLTLALPTFSAEEIKTTGNRYGNPTLYLSDISSAKAWYNVNRKKDENGKKPVIIDVRRVEEYIAGHPVGALSIPFPHVTGSPTKANDSDNGYIGYDITVDEEVGFLAADGKDGTLPIEDFVNHVKRFVKDKNQPIYLLCATGHRSVQAANALVKYGNYTQVQNIWEGYTGQPKYAYTGAIPTVSAGDATTPYKFVQLDLNHDGVFDNNDKDGWAFYQGLPIETKLVKSKLFNPTLYSVKK
jgi:rhodanese-related sulfurtransferase